jgi:hypothetical protein
VNQLLAGDLLGGSDPGGGIPALGLPSQAVSGSVVPEPEGGSYENNKAAKNEVHYRDSSSDSPVRCSTCEYYSNETCSKVQGVVRANDVCDIWDARDEDEPALMDAWSEAAREAAQAAKARGHTHAVVFMRGEKSPIKQQLIKSTHPNMSEAMSETFQRNNRRPDYEKANGDRYHVVPLHSKEFDYIGDDQASSTLAATDSYDDLTCVSDGVLLAGDARGGLIRVRQKAMRADAVNANNRIYPKAVVQAAIDEARRRAHAGAMLSNYLHPEIITKRNGEQVYEDRPLERTARIDEISDVGPDGWVSVDRTILKTDRGHEVASLINQKKPLGLSSRFKMRGHRTSEHGSDAQNVLAGDADNLNQENPLVVDGGQSPIVFDSEDTERLYVDSDEVGVVVYHMAVLDGREVMVADEMHIHTWDDVPNPAFADAGKDFKLLTDSQMGDLQTQLTEEGDAWSEAARTAAAAARAKGHTHGVSIHLGGEWGVGHELHSTHASGEEARDYAKHLNRKYDHFNTDKSAHVVALHSKAIGGSGETPEGSGDRNDRTILTRDTQTQRQRGAPPYRELFKNSGGVSRMNEKIRGALNTIYAKVNQRAPREVVADAHKALVDAINAAHAAGEDIVDATQARLQVDEVLKLQGYENTMMGGYHSGPSLTGIPGSATGTNPDGHGWGGIDLMRGSIDMPNAPRMEEPSDIINPEGRAPGMDKVMRFISKHEEAEALARRAGDVRAAADEQRRTILSHLSPEDQDFILNPVVSAATDAATVRAMTTTQLDAYNKRMAREKPYMDKILKYVEAQERQEADAVRKQAIQTACDAQRTTVLRGLSQEDQDYILSVVSMAAQDADQVTQLVSDHLEMFSARLAKERLRGGGYDPSSTNRGNATYDPSAATNRERARTQVTEGHPLLAEAFGDSAGQAPAYLGHVGRLLLASDEYLRGADIEGVDSPDNPTVRSRRVQNLKRLQPLLKKFARHYGKDENISPEQWFAQNDALCSGGEGAFVDAVTGGNGMNSLDLMSDAVLTSNLFSQPTILMAILIQKLWDSRMFQFVQGYGPGAAQAGGGAGWIEKVMPDGSMGSVFRLPVEYRDYANMSGYAGRPLPQYDPGYLVPENTGADSIQWAIRWLEFAPSLRSVALQISREAMLALGHSPANYNALGRGIWHAGNDMQLRLDLAMANEFVNISDEYLAVAVAAEAPNYTNNSVYIPGGSTSVNLNPAKTAAAAIAATDPSVTYGANVVAAIRLQSAGLGTASPFFANAITATPIVPPRTLFTLSAAGQPSSSTQNPANVAIAGGTGAAAVQGTFDATGNIVAFAGGATPNYAIDFINGVAVFTAGYTGLSNNAGVAQAALSSVTTFNYTYATNFDTFQVNNVTLGTGITTELYLNGLLGQIDLTAAKMGQTPRYVVPDLALSSHVSSTYVTRATAFWQWASPKQTELYPSPDFYAARNDLQFARHNAPWRAGDRRIQLTRLGSTKYGIEEPFTVRGPQFSYDSGGKPIQKEVILGYERSAIFTPQVTDQSGNILNPVGRAVLLY